MGYDPVVMVTAPDGTMIDSDGKRYPNGAGARSINWSPSSITA